MGTTAPVGVRRIVGIEKEKEMEIDYSELNLLIGTTTRFLWCCSVYLGLSIVKIAAELFREGKDDTRKSP